MKSLKKLLAVSLLTTIGFSGSSIKPAEAGGTWDWLTGICASILVVDYGCGVCTRLFSNNPRMLHDMILGR